MQRLELNTGWLLRYEDLKTDKDMAAIISDKTEGWLHTDLPCDVHVPLIKNGIIKEPLQADYSYECEWTEEKSWWFKKVFAIDNESNVSDMLELNIESIDGEADIFLNNINIGHHISAFYPFKKEVGKYLKPGENVLLVRVTSGAEHVSEYELSGIKKFISTERSLNRGDRGDERRAYCRYPQYKFGWDWGPRVVTCGIVKGIYLDFLEKIEVRAVHVSTDSITKDALLNLEVENLHPFSTTEAVIKLEISLQGVQVIDTEYEVLLKSGLNYFDFKTIIPEPKLWWPNGMGEQPLYTIKVTAKSYDGYLSEYPVFKYGIRTIELDMEKLNKEERRFAFKVNGVSMFSKGGNWIPADSIYARITDEKYDVLLKEAKEANFNMLRIWGGGFYEKDIFYEKCDEYGLLLWHDFMFACAVYPDNEKWFVYEVKREIDYQTKRLRNHASMALWCGSNENLWFFDIWGEENKPPFFGGATCYNTIAPSLVRKNCKNIPYWNSSPYGGVHPNEENSGDQHHWFECTMSPEMEKRITPEEYDKINAKFVSEYGYLGPCKKPSILEYHGGQPIDTKSRTWELHTNTLENDLHFVNAGIEKHYISADGLNMDEWLLYGGLCQGLMLGYSLEALRFKQGCNGAMFWMYNDCWGELGWTVIDYYLRRKIAYYFVKRAFEPVKLIMRENEGVVTVVGINDTKEPVEFAAEYGYVSFDGSKRNVNTESIELKPYSRESVICFKRAEEDTKNGVFFIKSLEHDCTVKPAVLRLHSYRDLNIPKAQLEVSELKFDNNTVRFTVKSLTFAHAVHFNVEDNICLSDEYFDLLPGESVVITAFGINTEDVKIEASCV